MPGHMRDYIIVLPDSAAGQAVAGQLRAEAAYDARTAGYGTRAFVLSHPSGRPWIVARPVFRKVSHITLGDDRLVLIGPDQVPVAMLAELLGGARDNAGLQRRLSRLPGLHHVVSRVRGELWIRGTATGLRRVYHAPHPDAGLLVSDRPAVLAHLTGAPVDDSALALRMLDFLPHPLSARPVWQGVREIEPGYALTLTGTGERAHHGVRRWWEAPAAELSLEQGAERLAEAVTASVRAHIGGLDRISCELSGGMDSTSLTFVAQRAAPAELALLTVAARDRYCQDESWAVRAVDEARAREPGASPARLSHHLIPADDAPYFYADLSATAGELNDEPLPVAPGRARAHLLLGRARATGSRYHLTGYGGDELFLGLPNAYRDLFHGNPLTALSRISALRHQLGWPLGPTVRALLARPSFGAWLAGAVTAEAQATSRTPMLSWGVRQSLCPWFTDHAASLITREFREAAADAEPLAPRPGRHVDIDAVRMGARHFQAMEDIGMTIGLPVAAPFYDDRVLEATLAVRLSERMTPWRYKPLLAEAMRGVVPDALLARTTKDHMSSDEHQGLREHAPGLRRLWTGSRLAERGLVDAGHLLRLADEPFSPVLVEHSISSTVAGETWLRTAEDAWPVPGKRQTTISEAIR